MRTSRLLAAIAVASSLVGGRHAVAATSPPVRCQTAKLIAIGKAAQKLLHCDAKLALGRPSTACASRALAQTKAFAKADAHGGCLTSGDAGDMQSRLEAVASTFRSVIAPNGGLSRCAAGEFDAVGGKLRNALQARAKDIQHPDAQRLADALAAAEAKFQLEFAAAQAFADCLSNADPNTERGRVDAWAGDFEARLWPSCGDDVKAGAEDCDGSDNDACPQGCTASCSCPVCGNGVREPGEACDGTDDTFCPGLCQGNCTCPVPICGDGVVQGGEACDGSAAQCAPVDPGCFPPGDPNECQCCSASVCEIDSVIIRCCPGTVCQQTGGIHLKAVCLQTCSQPADCRGQDTCVGGRCCQPSGQACGQFCCHGCNGATNTCN